MVLMKQLMPSKVQAPETDERPKPKLKTLRMVRLRMCCLVFWKAVVGTIATKLRANHSDIFAIQPRKLMRTDLDLIVWRCLALHDQKLPNSQYPYD